MNRGRLSARARTGAVLVPVLPAFLGVDPFYRSGWAAYAVCFVVGFVFVILSESTDPRPPHRATRSHHYKLGKR